MERASTASSQASNEVLVTKISPTTSSEMKTFAPDFENPECQKYIPPDAHGEVQAYEWTWKAAVFAVCMGLIFGIALEKSGVYQPQIIIDQFVFVKWTMFKTFMSAVATSVLVQAFLSTVGLWKPAFRATRSEFFCGTCHCDNVRGVPSTVVGSLILGIGMAFGGACPGTCFAQLGAGMWQGLVTVAGGLLAAVLYGFITPYVEPAVFWGKIKYASIDAILNIRYWLVSIPLFLLLVAVVALIESLRSWTVDTPQDGKHSMFLLVRYWPPEVGGAMIGLLHIPAILAVVVTLGSSSTFMVAASVIMVYIFRVDPEKHTGFKPFVGNTWVWQMVYLLGAVGGSALSAATAGHIGKVPGFHWWQHFIGGFLMIIGSRIAGGCTSGHGISGASQLITNSWISIPCIFGGGIGTGFILKAVAPTYWMLADSK